MRISKTTLTILISMLVISIFVANVANLLNNELYEYKRNKLDNTPRTMDGSPDHLIWFLQISDIHLSIFRDQSRITEFREFCDYTITAVKPSVVLASGDLTDAKTRDNIGSRQYEGEWIQYRNILTESKVEEKTAWLDIRGNHDNFNVAGKGSKENFFLNYSVQGKAHPRSYLYQVTKNQETYSFLGIDACLEPGPRRPFNFVGMLDMEEIHELHKLTKKIENSDSNYTIWFGHFPTSCILSQGEHIRSLIGKLDQGMAYLCGHLHRLGGLVPNMYTLQKDGFLELELGDWKDNRVFRLLAIDHGLLSFIDVTHHDWPIALITNPKHALFIIPGKESLETIARSTHIRVLAFSLSKITEVKVKIKNDWITCKHVKGPLYVAPWNPEEFSEGLHSIYVYVKDKHGREKILNHPFSLDGSTLSFGILSKIALMSNASTVFKFMFASCLVVSILPLCIFRMLHKLVKENKLDKPHLRRCFFRNWTRRLWILSTVDRIFWPLVLYPVYLSFGPWSVGHIIEDYVGVIFAWGIYVNGTFLPGSFTYAYGFLQLITFQIPITFILGTGVDHTFERQVLKPGKRKTAMGMVFLHTPFLVMFTMQLFMAYFFWSAYGTMAFVLGPLRTWSCVLALVLWQQALNLPEKCTREAAQIWSVKGDSETDINLTTRQIPPQ